MNDKSVLKLGQKAKILKHGYCFHFGVVGEITKIRERNGQVFAVAISFGKIPENSPLSYRKWAFEYWLPVLFGEYEQGKFSYFEIVETDNKENANG